jgi:DNA-binding transcriptional MerR regulator
MRSSKQRNDHRYGTKEICELIGISARQLEYWVLIGVVIPRLERHGAKVFKKFSRKDADILRRVKDLTSEGVLVSRAADKVRHLASRKEASGA